MFWYLIDGVDGALGCNPTLSNGELLSRRYELKEDDFLDISLIRQDGAEQTPIRDVLQVGLDLAVSRRVHNLFRLCRLHGGIRFCDARIRHFDGTLIKNYVFYRSLILHEVINHAMSRVKYLDGSTVIQSMEKWVLSRNQLPDVDLFRCEEWRWICSDRLMELVTGIGATGIRFLPVEVV